MVGVSGGGSNMGKAPIENMSSKGKAPIETAPIEIGDDSSMDDVIALSDSESIESSHFRHINSCGRMRMQTLMKLKMKMSDLTHDRLCDRVLDKLLLQVLGVFPHACRRVAIADLASQLTKTSPQGALERILNRYAEEGAPKAKQEPPQEPIRYLPKVMDEVRPINPSKVVSSAGTSRHVEQQQVNEGSEVIPLEVQANYNLWSLYALMKSFPRYPLHDLRRAFAAKGHKFTPCYKAISSDYAVALATEQGGYVINGGLGYQGPSRLNKRSREYLQKPDNPCHIFEREWQSIQNASREGGEQSRIVMDACKDEAPGDIECGCCCSNYRFEEMVQCAEGHLFCFTCLRRRIEESTFGGSKTCNSLSCMDTSGCEESFPWSEVQRALPPDVLAKYEQRQAEDAVLQAKITGLVYCPFCNTPWELDPDVEVLECENESCQKASCVLCKEPHHAPLQCKEVEKNSETFMRRSIEETMTKALLRECSVCKAELLKSDGCNKITCRCGKTMCYVCRQPIEPNYDHFCRHARVGTNTQCTKCKKCNLWEQEEEDEIVKAAREAAMKELAKEDPSLLKRNIGPKLEAGPKKKQRAVPYLAIPFQPPVPEYYNRMAQAMVNAAEQLI